MHEEIHGGWLDSAWIRNFLKVLGMLGCTAVRLVRQRIVVADSISSSRTEALSVPFAKHAKPRRPGHFRISGTVSRARSQGTSSTRGREKERRHHAVPQ